MDEDNLHTSVVIQLGNEGDESRYKDDYEDLEPPKNYVIDQIFCGENVTVYALFEVGDVTNEKSTDVDESTSGENYRICPGTPYKAVNEKTMEGCRRMSSDEEMQFLSIKDKRNDSFYCVKPFGGSQDISSAGEETPEIKVLFSKEVVVESPQPTKFKAVSRGVNTDIAQCPKLLEEVQKVVALNFAVGKEDVGTFPGGKPYEVIEVDSRHSSSFFSSELEIKSETNPLREHILDNKSSPNFVLVPLILMDDGILDQFRKESKRQTANTLLPDSTTPHKISLGINTSPAEISVQNDKEKNKMDLNQTFQDLKPQPDLNRTILEEIKSLQWKLNALIKSLESNNVELGTGDALMEKTPNAQKENSELVDAEPNRRNPKMFDQLPIFSPVNILPPPNKHSTLRGRKKMQTIDRWEVKEMLLPSTSVTLMPTGCLTPPQVADKKSKPEQNEEKLSWRESGTWRGVTTSRSESNLPDAKNQHAIKKSLSFEKLEIPVAKKIRNASVRLEGLSNIKPSLPVPQDGDTFENGKTNSERDLDQSEEKLTENVENNEQETEKSQNGEEDEKLSRQKSTVITPKVIQNQEKIRIIHEKLYCSSSSTVPESFLKAEKPEKAATPTKSKLRSLEKTSDRALKHRSDSEKTVTYKSWKRPGSSDSSGRNETKAQANKMSLVKNKIPEKITKPERRDSCQNAQEPTKQKCCLGSRKTSTRSIGESKLHAEKPAKRPHESDQKLSQTQKLEEKSTGKSDMSPRRPRPPAQKRRDQGTTSSASRKTSVIMVVPKSANKQSPKESADQETVSDEKAESLEVIPNELKVTPNSSSVIFELFSKKPAFVEDIYNEFDQDYPECEIGGNLFDEKTLPKEDTSNSCDSCENQKKAVAKSVWALTKVLLFEDGTKKLEVLEASSTPPGYSLKVTTNETPP